MLTTYWNKKGQNLDGKTGRNHREKENEQSLQRQDFPPLLELHSFTAPSVKGVMNFYLILYIKCKISNF